MSYLTIFDSRRFVRSDSPDTTFLLPVKAGGTNADLSATGGANQVLKQSSVGGNVTVAALAAGDVPDGALSSNVPLKNAANTFSAAQTISTNGLVLTDATNGTIKERNRSTAMGEWISPTFNAGDFTASGSMTWTVASGDVVTYKYTLIGKTMIVALTLNTTTVGGTPSTGLQVAIPGGFTANATMNATATLLDNNVRTTGRLQVAAAGTIITITRTDNAVWTASTDLTYVFGQIAFEVQ